MSAGSKLSIAIIVLFGVLLGVYYGFGGPGVGSPALQSATGTSVADPGPIDPQPAVATPTPEPVSPWAPPQARPEPAESGSEGIRLLRFQETRRRSGPDAGGDEADGAPGAFYTVQAEDSMWIIARKWLGDGTRWEEIAKLNPGINPDRLDVGMKLRMPPQKRDQARTETPAAPTTPASGTSYTVREGDTLATIAARIMGKSSRWEAIYDANRGVIGPDPHRLKVGMKLTIPK